MIRKWWRWAGRELDWAWNGGRRFWIISAAALFAGATGTNWWLDREQTGGPNSREWRRRKK